MTLNFADEILLVTSFDGTAIRIWFPRSFFGADILHAISAKLEQMNKDDLNSRAEVVCEFDNALPNLLFDLMCTQTANPSAENLRILQETEKILRRTGIANITISLGDQTAKTALRPALNDIHNKRVIGVKPSLNLVDVVSTRDFTAGQKVVVTTTSGDKFLNPVVTEVNSLSGRLRLSSVKDIAAGDLIFPLDLEE